MIEGVPVPRGGTWNCGQVKRWAEARFGPPLIENPRRLVYGGQDILVVIRKIGSPGRGSVVARWGIQERGAWIDPRTGATGDEFRHLPLDPEGC